MIQPDSTPASTPFTTDTLSARLLPVYLAYRLLLALLLLASFVANLTPSVIGSSNPDLYLYTASLYLLATLVDAISCHRRYYRPHSTHLLFILLIDVSAHIFLMSASGGLSSGIGYLMLVTVAAGSIFFADQLAVLVAAIASIGIIAEAVSQQVLGSGQSTLFPAGVLGIFLFITALLFQGLNRALHRAEAVASLEAEQSAQLQKLNEGIINHMLTGVLVVDSSDTIELINQAAARLLGGNSTTPPLRSGDTLAREPLLAEQLHAWRQTPWLRPAPFMPHFGNTDVQVSFKQVDQGGRHRALIFLEDFRVATQQAQQLKLAALGHLAGSIAHEIRNPLGAISHASQLLDEQLRDHSATTRLTAIIAKQVRRMNQIVENVLELSRPRPHHLEKIDLPHWLRHHLDDYRHSHQPPPVIETEITDDDMVITFDSSHLHQVLSNLLDNAVRHSRHHSGTPWVKVRVAQSGIDSLPVVDIFDRGPGVAEHNREQIFEPFYTTSGDGSGLGLYIARQLCAINYATLKYQACDQHRGYFRISFAHPGKILGHSVHD